MNNVIINNELNLTYPDGFHEMSEEELTKYFSTPADRWGVFNSDEFILLSVKWTKAGFKRTFTDAESYMIELEAILRRRLVNYQRLLEFKTKVGGKKAQGIRFEYRVKDSVRIHVGDLITFKYKKYFYSILYLTRKKNAAAARPAFQEVLNSVTLK